MSWSGGVVGPATRCVLADNPGPMTLDGTNTWVVHAAGRAVVVDPGPLEPRHLAAVLRAVAEVGARVTQVVLTHSHLDHGEGAGELAARAGGVPVRSLAAGLRDGDVLPVGDAGDVLLRVVATPGHTSDSVCLLLDGEPGGPALLTGDTVLGRGTTVVAHPDGRLAPYLGSLRRLRTLVGDGPRVTVLPGHGPVLPDAARVLDAYLSHRAERLEQVRQAVAAGDEDAAAVVRRVYADVAPAVRAAAELSVRAQLEYLREEVSGTGG